MSEKELDEIPLVAYDVLDALEFEIQDPAIYADYIRQNLGMWPARYENLADAIRMSDITTAMDAMQSLRSASQMIGAIRLVDMALRMESALHGGKLEEAKALLPSLEACGVATIDQLSQAFEPMDPFQLEVSDWRVLVGCQVEIQFPNGVTDAGTVEAVTFDGEILWLQQQGAVPRRLVERERGMEIRVLARESDDKASLPDL